MSRPAPIGRCEPSPADREWRWHWLKHGDDIRPAEYHQYADMLPMWTIGQYYDSGTATWMYDRGWRYLGPAIPPSHTSQP
jgi:hypothetical protein